MSDAEPKPGMGAVGLISRLGSARQSRPGPASVRARVCLYRTCPGRRHPGYPISAPVGFDGSGRAGGPERRRRCWPGSTSPSDRTGNGHAGVVGHPGPLNTFSGCRRLPEIKIEIRPGGCLEIVRLTTRRARRGDQPDRLAIHPPTRHPPSEIGSDTVRGTTEVAGAPQRGYRGRSVRRGGPCPGPAAGRRGSARTGGWPGPDSPRPGRRWRGCRGLPLRWGRTARAPAAAPFPRTRR
jgi:hypothetical protein